METFNITFHMNNGDLIHIVEQHDEGYDFKSSLNNNKKWFRHGEKIVNLDNVNYVDVKTEIKRTETEDVNRNRTKEFEFWS